jgi:hypothetical protein
MNPIDTDPRVTAEMLTQGKVKLSLLSNGIKRMVELMLGEDFSFVVVIRHKNEAKTMLIVAEVDNPEEISSIITEAYQRHTQPDINRFSAEELLTPVNKH